MEASWNRRVAIIPDPEDARQVETVMHTVMSVCSDGNSNPVRLARDVLTALRGMK